MSFEPAATDEIRTDAVATSAASSPSPWRNPIRWFWHQQDSSSRHAPVVRTLWALVLIAGSVVGSELYEWARNKAIDPDQYVKELAAKQETTA